MLLDADSEILTAITQLPANGDEAANAPTLIETEQAAHHNQVQALSIDSIGFNGPMLRTLTDPEGLDLTVYVPPHSQGITDSPYYRPDDFDLSQDGTDLSSAAKRLPLHDRRHAARHNRAGRRHHRSVVLWCDYDRSFAQDR